MGRSCSGVSHCAVAASLARRPHGPQLTAQEHTTPMATSAERRLRPKEVRRFGSLRAPHPIPDLTQIQTHSYEALSAVRRRRRRSGRTRASKACCARSSRSRATTRTLKLEYIRYELGKPRYEPHECRQLRLTYGRPFRVWLRLTKEAADRGRSLSGRHADHARRRRVHHQRRRARRGQPVAPQPRRRLRHRDGRRRAASSTAAASFPSAAAGSS